MGSHCHLGLRFLDAGAPAAAELLPGVEVADIKYLPPEDFYIPKVEAMGVEITARVSALMPYAAAVESRGYDVLSQVFTGFISNPQQYFSEIQDEIARNEVASSLTVRQG